MRYLVILNEEAGQAGKAPAGTAPEELRAAFAGAGIEAEVRLAAPGRIEDTLHAAVAERPDAVIVGGGDGTVRGAAAVLAGTGIPLGVLPLGTFNHFARDLKMPVDPKEAVAALVNGVPREVDLGEVNGQVFINNCSIGAYAEAVRRRDALRERRGLRKWWAMWRASFEEFRRLRRLRLRISTRCRVGDCADLDARGRRERRPDKEPVSRPVRTPVVVVGNNRYSGHLLSQHLRPRLDEGRLWLYTVQARRHLAVLRMLFQSLVGKLDEAAALAAEPATTIVIASECGPVPVAADGEMLPVSPPLHFRIRPRALRVLVPGAPRAGQEAAPAGQAEVGGISPPDAALVSRYGTASPLRSFFPPWASCFLRPAPRSSSRP